jgi:hypothetical protein
VFCCRVFTPLLLLLPLLGLSACAARTETPAASAKSASSSPFAAPSTLTAAGTTSGREQSDTLLDTGSTAGSTADEVRALEQRIAEWERRGASAPADAALATRLAEAYSRLADLRRDEPAEAVAGIFSAGLRAAQSSLLAGSPAFRTALEQGSTVEDALSLLVPEAASSLYWYAANLSGYAASAGITASVRLASRIEGCFQRLLSIDESFGRGAAHRAYGGFLARAPTAAGGDPSRARAHFERALALDPTSIATREAYAESFALLVQDRGLFTRLLQEAAAGHAQSPSERLAQARAQALLARVDQLF